MARTEGDTWDLASSVGATATGVAASRALASKQPSPLISDPFADALVKAVGLDYCNRMADGELEFTDDAGKGTARRLYLQLKSGNSHLLPPQIPGRKVYTF